MLFLHREVNAAFFAKCGNDEARLVLSRATGRAHHFDLVFRWCGKNAGLRAEESPEHSRERRLRLRFQGTTRSGSGLGVRFFADLRLTHEGGTLFDGECAGGDVADEDGVALEFAAFLHGDVAFDFAEDDDGAGFDFAFDQRVFTDGEAAVRNDFTFNPAVDDEIVGKFDGAFDFDVVGKNVFAGGHDRG